MRRWPRPAVTTSSTPSRKARCIGHTKSGSPPETSAKAQLCTVTLSAVPPPRDLGQESLILCYPTDDLGRLRTCGRRPGFACYCLSTFADAGLATYPQSVVTRAASRQGVQREAGQKLVAPRRKPEVDHLVAKSVELGRPAAAAGPSKRRRHEPPLFELGQVHAGDVGMQVETFGDLGNRHIRARVLSN